MEKILHQSVAKLLQLEFIVGCLNHDWNFEQKVVQVSFTNIEEFDLKATLKCIPVECIYSIRIIPGTNTAFIYLNAIP